MKRTLEKLAKDREDKEGEFSEKIEEIRKQANEFKDPQSKQKLQHLVSRLEEILTSVEETPSKKRKSSFTRSSKTLPEDASQRGFNNKNGFDKPLNLTSRQVIRIQWSLLLAPPPSP